MKSKHSPSVLLPAAAILSAVSSLGASAATPADAAAATIGRSGAGAAQQDLIESATRPRPSEPEPARNSPSLEAPSTGFRFDPPATKPELSLSKEERARLDEIGTDLVGFVHAQERIAEDRDKILEKKLETGKKQRENAENSYSEARMKHRDALTDLRDAERSRDDAVKEAEAAVAKRESLREALETKKDENRQRSEETEAWMEKLKAEKARVSEAQEAQDEAAGRLQAEKSAQSEIERQLAENVKALVSATNDVAQKVTAVADRKKDAAERAEKGRKAVEASEKAVGEAVAAGAKAVDDRRKEAAEKAGAADAARAAFRRAKDDEAEKAGAKESARRDREAAQKSLDRAKRGVEAAREAVAEAESDRDAAVRHLEEARRKDAETKGWFSRLFIPSVERAERRANAAEQGVADSKGRAVSAEKNARDAALALDERDKALSAADAAWKKAVGVTGDRRKDWDGALSEQSAAEGRIEEAKAAAKAARKEAEGKVEEAKAAAKADRRDAERQIDEAARAESDARKDARRAKGAVEDSEDALAGKKKDVARAEKVVLDRSERTEAAEAQRRAVENEKGMGINLLTERELDEKLGEAVHDVLAKNEEKSEREIAAEKARQEVGRTQAGEEKARKALATAHAFIASAEQTSGDEARDNEKLHQEKISAAEKSFWDQYRKDQVRDAPDLVKKDPKALEGELETAKAGRDKAAETKTAAEAARDKARAGLASAEARAKTSRDALAKAKRAAEDADRALGKAQDRATDAQAALDKARAAQSGAKDPARAAEAVQAASEALAAAKKAVKDASDGKKAGLEALQAADKEAKDAQTAAGEAAKALKDAETSVSGASRDLAVAEKDVKARESAIRAVEGERAGMASRVDRAVDDMRSEFWRQVEAARRAELEKIRRANWTDSQKRHQAAIDARRNYKEAKAALAREKRNYDRVCEDEQAKGLDSWRTSKPVQDARAPYKKAREAFKEAEVEYNRYYSDGNTFKTAPIPDADAIRVVEEAQARLRDEYGARVRFDGDRLWLARTSVNGVSLLDSFFDEMAWQVDDDIDRAQTPEDYARAAAAYTRDRAIYGGFYFAGLDVESKPVSDPATGEKTGTTLVVFADKGRFGPSDVVFVDAEGNTVSDTNGVPATAGAVFSKSDILGRFVSRDAATNELEGQAFNFVEFRQNFNALNADPDIKKADVVFRVAPSTFEYDYDSGLTNYPARVPRAIQAEIKVEEDPNWWNLLMPRPLSPLHGVFSIDNFNSMGETDKPLGEADTWMARATLQRQHRFLGRDAALTLNGNVSLGGSLYGGAASWFLARPEDRGWVDGGWRDWALTLHGGYTEVDQGDVVPSLDVLGTGYYGGLQATTRLVDTLDSALDLSFGLTYRYVESSVRIDGQEIKLGPNGGDGYTILPLSVALMYSDKALDSLDGRNYATVEGVYNLGGSSADELAAFRSAIDDERYMLLRAQLARIQLLGSDSSSWWIPRMAFLRGEVQWANTPVIGAEQFGLGGHGTVRGYAERLFMGDTGASATLEFRTPINVWSIFTRVPGNPYRASERFQLVYFADVGYFMLEEGTTNAQGAREDDSEFIASIGAGIRYSWDDFALRFDWGVPLVRDDDKYETSSAGVGHASLNYQF